MAIDIESQDYYERRVLRMNLSDDEKILAIKYCRLRRISEEIEEKILKLNLPNDLKIKVDNLKKGG